MAEAIIFAGKDAWIHAKDWQENNRAEDKTPPVILGEKQLAELDSLRIVDKGRRYARVCRAGKLNEIQITTIATKLALAGVQEAFFYSESHELLENWTEQLARLKADAESGNGLVKPHDDINLLQMADNEKAKLLASRYQGIAIHGESEAAYIYQDGIWNKTTQLELCREMVAVYNEQQTNFNKRAINNIVEALKMY